MTPADVLFLTHFGALKYSIHAQSSAMALVTVQVGLPFTLLEVSMTVSQAPRKGRGRRRTLLGVSIFLILLATALAAVSPVPDLKVYRFGADAWLHGIPLYSPTPPKLADFGLPFTYPPFAALLFTPLALLPARLGSVLLAWSDLAVLAWVTVLVSRRGRAYLPAAVAASAFAVIFFDPVRITVMAGQVNVLLLGLVVADCLTRHPRWPRGILIGLAAAVKLTPLFFIVYLVARRQYRAAAVATGTFAGASAVGALVAPSDSRFYWLHALADTDRIGPNIWPINQSLHGVLARFGLAGPTLTIAWLALALAATAAAYLCASRIRHDTVALLVVATAALLASPVSWTHHWVWIAVAAPLAWRVARRKHSFALTTTVLAAFAVFILGVPYTMTMLSDPGTGWSLLKHVYGDSYTLVAAAILTTATIRVLLPKRAPAPTKTPEPAQVAVAA
jgi:alpha-1,2-mannosyltransferase